MYICNMKANIPFKISFLDKGIRETLDVDDGKILYTNFTKHIKRDHFNVYYDERTIEDLFGEDVITLQIEKSRPFYDAITYL